MPIPLALSAILLLVIGSFRYPLIHQFPFIVLSDLTFELCVAVNIPDCLFLTVDAHGPTALLRMG